MRLEKALFLKFSLLKNRYKSFYFLKQIMVWIKIDEFVCKFLKSLIKCEP